MYSVRDENYVQMTSLPPWKFNKKVHQKQVMFSSTSPEPRTWDIKAVSASTFACKFGQNKPFLVTHKVANLVV